MLGLFDGYFLKDHGMREKKMPVDNEKVLRPEKYKVAKATMQLPQILSKCKYAYSHSITNIFITYDMFPLCCISLESLFIVLCHHTTFVVILFLVSE